MVPTMSRSTNLCWAYIKENGNLNPQVTGKTNDRKKTIMELQLDEIRQ
jgi:hypothetical protein